MSDYLELRRKNIEDNERILRSLQLMDNPEDPSACSLFTAAARAISETMSPSTSKRASATRTTRSAPRKYQCQMARTIMTRSRRNSVQSPSENSEDLEEKVDQTPVKKIIRENTFGHIPDVAVGTAFQTRLECSRAGVHRPTVAGIHGSEKEGAFSLALSGGYEDDVDNGDFFVYTGSGGRDLHGTKCNPKNLRTAPQSKDQELTKANLALSLNSVNGNPVRVVRGYKLKSFFAPEEGYRYDGLYKVQKYWLEKGASGFSVYKYFLQRIDDEPAPWSVEKKD